MQCQLFVHRKMSAIMVLLFLLVNDQN